MHHLVDATRQAVDQKNWYASLALALSMPDICGRIQWPHLKDKSQQRVVDWFDKYLQHNYQVGPRFASRKSMEGGDFYALRCAYLHQGDFDLDGQKARRILERFHLTAPGPGVFHNNLRASMDSQGNPTGTVLQLSIDLFCEEVCTAVEAWLSDASTDTRIMSEISGLGQVQLSYNF